MLTAKRFRIVCALMVFSLCLVFGNVLSADSYELSLEEDFKWRVNGRGEVVITGLVMFRGVTEVYIPEQIDNKPVTGIDGFAFSGSERLERIYLSKTITYIAQDAFINTHSLKEILVAEDNESFTSKDGILYSKDMSELCKVPKLYEGALVVPDTVNSIWQQAVLDTIYLESIYLPKNAQAGTKEYPNIFSNMFAYATALKEIIVSDEHASYSSKNGVMYSKDGKTLISVPPAYEAESFVIPDHVEHLVEFAFGMCKNIKEITIPKSVTNIEQNSIFACRAVEKVVLQKGVPELCGKVFISCVALHSVYIPNDIRYLGPEVFEELPDVDVIYYDDPSEIDVVERTDDSTEKVQENESIGDREEQPPDISDGSEEQEPEDTEHDQEEIVIPSSSLLNKHPVRSGETNIFTYDVIDYEAVVITGLTEEAELKARDLQIPVTIDGLPVQGIGRSAFVRQPIDSVILQEGIQEIGYGAFYGCNLKKLVIPSTVSCIETLAFKGNLGLEHITVDKKNPVYCSDNGVLYTKDKKILIQVPENYRGSVFNVPDGVNMVWEYALAGNRWIEYIGLPDDHIRLGERATWNMLSLKHD